MTARTIRASLAATALAASTLAAAAADLPPRMPAMAPVIAMPAFNWSGVYFGINGGGIWGSSSWKAGGTTADIDTSGGLIGGTIGFNVQNGIWVWGLEADLGWAGNDGNTTTGCAGTGCFVENSWLGTARARIGFAADRFMPYLTGGAAFGNVKAHFNTLPEASDTSVGWTIGGGVEFAVAGSWSAKLEYLYVDLGGFSCATANCGVPGPVDVDLTANIFRAGLNYKFDLGVPGPLARRY